MTLDSQTGIGRLATRSTSVNSLCGKTFHLSNGLTVITHEDHTSPFIAVSLWYHVGSGRESRGRSGLAHLLEHLMFKGSAHVASNDFHRLLNGVGGKIEAGTNEDRTYYSTVVPSNALELSMFLESDRMGFFLDALTPDKLEIQRQVVMNEYYLAHQNRPYGAARLLIRGALYPDGHPYRSPTIGYNEDLVAITLDDVGSFYRRFYSPANASLAVVGAIVPDAVHAVLEKWFSDVDSRPRPGQITVPATHLSREVRSEVCSWVSRPRLYMAWRTPPWLAPGNAEIDLLATILAGSVVSRLHKRLVTEQSLAIDVHAEQWCRHLESTFVVSATSTSTDLGRIEQEIRRTMDALCHASPFDEELKRAIGFREAGLLRQLQTIEDRAEAINAYYMATGDPDSMELAQFRYHHVTQDDMRTATRRLLGEKCVILAIIPDRK